MRVISYATELDKWTQEALLLQTDRATRYHMSVEILSTAAQLQEEVALQIHNKQD